MADCGNCHHEGARISAPATTGRQDDGVKKDPEHVTSVRACAGEGADALAEDHEAARSAASATIARSTDSSTSRSRLRVKKCSAASATT